MSLFIISVNSNYYDFIYFSLSIAVKDIWSMPKHRQVSSLLLVGSVMIGWYCKDPPITGTPYSIGKQSPCLLSFVYTSYNREHDRTAHNVRNHALLFSY